MPRRSELFAGIAGLFLIFFSVMTWRQTQYWKDSFTLFTHAIAVTSDNFIAENNLGEAFMQHGRPDDAYPHFLRATQAKPHFGLGHYNLGLVLMKQTREAEALQEFQTAVRYGQDNSEIASAYHNIGIVMLGHQQYDDAIRALSEALRLVPTKQSSLLARGMAEFESNRFAAAEQDLIAGANLAPDPAACYWIGRTREAEGKISGAIEAYQQTLALQPDMTEAKERLNALRSGKPMPFIQPTN
jgi:tetratricopeptide (TPR) repeat protein